MKLDEIAGLVKIFEESSLTTMKVREGELRISLSKLDNPPVVSGAVPAFAPAPALSPQAPAPAQDAAPQKEDDEAYITSPIVGTFYSAPAPDAPAFVKVGDHVKDGQTVCILEAMKLMNEIQADFDCEIEAVLVSNEQKVEYGQPLFRVKKV